MLFRIECPTLSDVFQEGEYHRQAIYKAANKLGLTGEKRAEFLRRASAFKVDSQRVGSGRTKYYR
jgi:hypothetical protein